jgi:hypothetical protein
VLPAERTAVQLSQNAKVSFRVLTASVEVALCISAKSRSVILDVSLPSFQISSKAIIQ